MITPAMLEEEEQLEAAGLERERKMLEKVILRARLPYSLSEPDAPSEVWFVLF